MSEEQPPEGQLLIYQDGSTSLQVRLDGQTIWLTQKQIGELYQSTKQNISLHIRSIFEDEELPPQATVKQYLTVQTEGQRRVKRVVDHYSLDVVLAIGYRVRSSRGTQFRQWATKRLNELLVKGFTLDDERIKAGNTIGQSYFDELLERLRDIRSSERLFYQKVTDIFASAIDYDGKSTTAKQFFATVQNKLHWAIHGQTAAEVIKDRADSAKPNMGLATWKNAPQGMIRKSDTEVAKNYLTEPELKELNRIVGMYLDYAEDRASKNKTMHMSDWITKLNSFLEFNERNILSHAGKVSHQLAIEHATKEFNRFKADNKQALENLSDFDREVKRLQQEKKKDGDE
ncbi:MAG: virulence RhuM family protein [Planctomycetes bacterium]|nr:virulence RhuM family protein [Planctomycetota bacterium]